MKPLSPKARGGGCDYQYLNIGPCVCVCARRRRRTGFNLHPLSCTTSKCYIIVQTVWRAEARAFHVRCLSRAKIHRGLIKWRHFKNLSLYNTQMIWPTTFFNSALHCAIIHRRVAVDKRLLHNAACYSFQEQSGAPPRVSIPDLRVSS